MKNKKLITFDMNKKPVRQRIYLTPLTWLLSFPSVIKHRLKINKVNMEGLKKPYILLCTHHSFMDFKVTTKATFPSRLNYVVAIDGFIKREWLLRNAGGICKRKFTNDTKLIKHMKYILNEKKGIVAIYPEARYSLIGTNAILPESLGKLIKLFKHPVVVLNMHGDYLMQPVWNLDKRNVKLAADMTQIIKKEEIETLSAEQINARINQAFRYDEYQYQFDNQIKIDFKNRLKGISRVLYQCPHCLKEHVMASDKNELWCEACGEKYVQDIYGQIKNTKGNSIFTHLPDWYEFQREQVRKQIEDGTYYFEDDVSVESLPNSKGYVDLGIMKLVHNNEGFWLYKKDGSFELKREVLSMYGLHIEYNYMNKGDCLDLSTLENTYYIYPLNYKNVVTKLHFAVEELYKIHKSEIK